jgi:hypothetical protein
VVIVQVAVTVEDPLEEGLEVAPRSFS